MGESLNDTFFNPNPPIKESSKVYFQPSVYIPDLNVQTLNDAMIFVATAFTERHYKSEERAAKNQYYKRFV